MTKPDKTSLNEQLIAASEQRLRALVNATSDIVYSLNADWSVMRELDGRGFLKDAPEPTSDWRSDNIYPDDLEMVNEAINKAIQEKKVFQMEHRVLRADRTLGWTFSRAIPIFDDKDEIIEWFGVASDITERKQAEENLREEKERSEQQKRLYETITAGTPDLIYVFDLNYRFTYANGALLNMWGKTWDNAIGKGLLENGYEPWHAEMHEREIDKVRDTKQPIRGEVSFPHATLGKRVYDYIFTPVLNEQGEVEAVAGTTRDVTERKQWEQKLKNSSEELQSANEEMASTNEELTATNEELSATNEELELVNQKLREAQQKIEEGEVALRLAIDAANFGTWFIHSVTREFIVDTRLKELFGYYPDESLSIEQALAQITEGYRGFVANKLENAIYHNGDYDVTYPVIGLHDERLRWLRAIGNLKADPSGAFSAFTGVVMDITDQYLAAQKIERAEESLRIATESGELGTWYYENSTGHFETSPRFNQIFGFPVGVQPSYEETFSRIHKDHQQKVADAVSASFGGSSFNVEYPLLAENNTQRWVRSVGKMVSDENGSNYITGVLADITEQKQDEVRKNDFIGMVSHELKTPLTSLNAILQVLEAKTKKSEDGFIPGALEKANQQVKKMTNMINGFLNISRLESGKIMIDKQPFIIGDLVKEVIEEMNLVGMGHIIDLQNCDKMVINADRDKIGSVISNLLSNAIKYSPKGSHILVNCWKSENELCFSVADEGLGIRPEETEKVFDRFYRVESNYTRHIAGFGIGLYLSAEIINRHNGRIWVESENGKGSTFYFCLPLKGV